MRFFALLLAVLAGCSNGIESEKVLPQPPVLTLTEEWRIDGYEHVLQPIGWAVVGPSKEIFIGRPFDSRILAFDSTGVRRHEFGGVGRNPGRFQNQMQAGTLADTLWVYDGVLRRVTLFGPNGALARSFIWPPVLDPETQAATGDATIPYLLGITPGGSIVSSVYRERRSQRADSAAVPADVAIAIPGRTLLAAHPVPRYLVYGGGFILDNVRLFPVDPLFAAASTGKDFVYIEPFVEGPDAGTFRVTRLDSAGDTLFVRQHPFYPVKIPREVADAAVEGAVRRLRARGQGTPAAINTFREAVRVSPVYPPIEGAVAGRDGSTWIRMRPLVEENSEYFVLDRSGDLAGQLSIPGGLEIVEAELTQVWAILTDTLDVSSLVVHSVAGYSPADP